MYSDFITLSATQITTADLVKMSVLQEPQAQGGDSLHLESSCQQEPVSAAVEDNLGWGGVLRRFRRNGTHKPLTPQRSSPTLTAVGTYSPTGIDIGRIGLELVFRLSPVRAVLHDKVSSRDLYFGTYFGLGEGGWPKHSVDCFGKMDSRDYEINTGLSDLCLCLF